MEKLTKTEEKVMQLLWRIKEGVVHDIIEHLPDPKPPYNTISSVVRILEEKGFVNHKAFGRTHLYFPIITKAEYRKNTFNSFLKEYFEGKVENVVSFMVNEKKMKKEDIEELMQFIEEQSYDQDEDK
jgi:BlaI family transcriptional regulator, penicillinase repressor